MRARKEIIEPRALPPQDEFLFNYRKYFSNFITMFYPLFLKFTFAEHAGIWLRRVLCRI
jgi:hypothetical protein